MTTLEITIRNKTTSEVTKIPCGIEGKDWYFKADEERRVLALYPDSEMISSRSESDKPVNYSRPTTYGMW